MVQLLHSTASLVAITVGILEHLTKLTCFASFPPMMYLNKVYGMTQDWTGICNTSFAERIWWNWRLDEELYPDWDGFAARLQSMGIQLMTYVNPFLMKDKSVKGAMYREAAERGFLIQNARSSTPRPYHMSHEITFGLIDLSNPEVSGCTLTRSAKLRASRFESWRNRLCS